MQKTFIPFILAALAMVAAPGAALAHAKLLSSTPAANATVAKNKAKSITLVFNEKLMTATVKAELVMTGMPGMKDHPPMKIAFTSMMGKVFQGQFRLSGGALVPGTYKVAWSAAGADTHRMGSEFSFTVK